MMDGSVLNILIFIIKISSKTNPPDREVRPLTGLSPAIGRTDELLTPTPRKQEV